jgi:hypothetical protein
MRKGLFRLWLGLVFTALVTGATIGMGFWLMPIFTERRAVYRLPDFTDPTVPAQLIVSVIMLLLSGLIARVIYAHLKFRSVVVLFLVLISVFWVIDGIIGQLLRFAVELGNSMEYVNVPSEHDIQRRAMMFVMVIPVFFVGMLAGTLFNTMIERGSGKRIVRIRRRLRSRQARLD